MQTKKNKMSLDGEATDSEVPSVARVRRALSEIRAMWKKHEPVSPMLIDANLFNGTSATEFAVSFVIGHHSKGGSRAKDAD